MSDIPSGYCADYEYYDEADLCRRRGVADYVSEPIMSVDQLLQRKREREARGDA